MYSNEESNHKPRSLLELFHSLCLAHCQQKHGGEEQVFFDALLLEDDSSSVDDPAFINLQRSVEQTSSFPLAPLYRTLGSNLLAWLVHDKPPWSSIKLDYINVIEVNVPWEFERDADELKNLISSSSILDSDDEAEDQSESVQGRIPELLKSEICNKVNRLLSHATRDIILKFLGVSKTIGSVQQPPPPLHRMYQSYVAIHHPSSTLTVGARALSKHSHRTSDCWWGECTGTIQEKNDHAVAVLLKVLEDVCWINVHTLPHDVWVVEVRCSLGYGLRWSHDGALFRGFLEPQMVDGHEKGWRH